MMNSSLTRPANDLITEMIRKLDVSLIQSRIDDPIDRAVQSFHYDVSPPFTYRQIHHILDSFVAAIYGSLGPATLSARPLDEALQLLEYHYRNAWGSGYAAAMLDLVNRRNADVDGVLNNIAQIIKAQEQEKYRNSIFRTYLDPNCWKLRCEIARLLLEKHKSILPPGLQRCPAEQLADSIPQLISLTQNTSTIVQKILDSYEK